MQFTVGEKTYIVFISPRPIVREGRECKAWCDFKTSRILLSHELKREERYLQLMHELWHAWVHFHGKPADDGESDALCVGSFSEAMAVQLDDQGGRAALEALNPPADSVPVSSAPIRTIRDRRTCNACQSEVMCGSFINLEPAFNESLGVYIMKRGMDCPCGATTVWFEQCLPNGSPLGVYLENPQPKILHGAELKAWQLEVEGAAV